MAVSTIDNMQDTLPLEKVARILHITGTGMQILVEKQGTKSYKLYAITVRDPTDAVLLYVARMKLKEYGEDRGYIVQ